MARVAPFTTMTSKRRRSHANPPPPRGPYKIEPAAAPPPPPIAFAPHTKIYVSPRCEIDDDVLFPPVRRSRDRWETISEIAGPHGQDGATLTITRSGISPLALKSGMTAHAAARVRRLNLWHLRDALDRNDDILPEWLDVVSALFPNLQHLTISKGISPSSSAAFPSPRIPKAKKSNGNGNGNGNGNASSDWWTTYEEDDLTRITRDEENKSVSVRMRRLYILYRMPHLKSIDNMSVSKSDLTLARPDSPNGKRVSPKNWLASDDSSSIDDDSNDRGTTDNDEDENEDEEQQHLLDDSESSNSDSDSEADEEDDDDDGENDADDENDDDENDEHENRSSHRRKVNMEITTACDDDDCSDILLNPESCKHEIVTPRPSSSWADKKRPQPLHLCATHKRRNQFSFAADGMIVESTSSLESNSADEKDLKTEVTVSLVGERLVELGVEDQYIEQSVIENQTTEASDKSRRDVLAVSVEVDIAGAVDDTQHRPETPKITADALRVLNERHAGRDKGPSVDLDAMSVASSQYEWSASCGVLSFGAFRRATMCSGSKVRRKRNGGGESPLTLCANEAAVVGCCQAGDPTKRPSRSRLLGPTDHQTRAADKVLSALPKCKSKSLSSPFPMQFRESAAAANESDLRISIDNEENRENVLFPPSCPTKARRAGELPPPCPGRRAVALKSRKCKRLLRRLRTSKQNARSTSVFDLDDDDDDDDGSVSSEEERE